MKRVHCNLFLLAVIIMGTGCVGTTVKKETPSTPTVSIGTKLLSGQIITYDNTQWPTESTIVDGCYCPRITNSGYLFHPGLNIQADTGDTIVSLAHGVVADINLESPGAISRQPPSIGEAYGNTVVIKHTLDKPFTQRGTVYNEYYSLYAHLETIGVSVGQTVSKGQKIGTAGVSGSAVYPHLHFGILLGSTDPDDHNAYINPLYFLPYDSANDFDIKVMGTNPVKVRVRVKRAEMDLRTITVVLGADTQTVDFDEHTSLDTTNPKNSNYAGVNVTPGPVNINQPIDDDYYAEWSFTFSNFNDYDSVTVTDIWGNGEVVTKN